MKHTYIMEPGKWTAIGKYYDNSQSYVTMRGEAETIHGKSEWTQIITAQFDMENPLEFCSKYLIKPLEPNVDYTFWRSHNPLFGHILGKFMMIDDMILSSFRSSDQQYTGTECLLRIDENFYKNWGFVFHEANKQFSWSTELRRI